MSKKQNKVVASLVMASLLVAIYGYFPRPDSANAVNSLTNAKALMSDSAPGVAATTTITFMTATSTLASGYFLVDMPTGFSTLVGHVACSDGLTALGTASTATCTGAKGVSTTTITLFNVTNPTATTSKVFNISHYDVAGNLAERVQVVVQIIDNVWMTARVDATLNFIVSGTSTGATVNGLTCTATTSATSTPFGTLAIGVRSNVCQQLQVTTNASQGFTVTVEEDREMTSDGGDNINSFDNSLNGTGSSTAHTWETPDGILDQDHTYGHMGLTSNDTDLNTLGGYVNTNFYNTGTPQFAGLQATVPMPVYHHDGPSDGVTQDKGRVMVLYSAQIHALQQAGDYENTLTYIATPTY